MKERICEQCGTQFEVEAGDSSPVCASCLIELKKETRFFLDEPKCGSGMETD